MADEKADLFRHLLHAHDVLITTSDYFDASIEDLRALDPCESAP